MPGKLLLIADDESFAQLDARCELVRTWLTDPTSERLLDRIEDVPPWIVRCDSSQLLPPDSADDSLASGDRTELIYGLLGGTICYLVYVDRRCWEENVEPKPKSLADHVEWYERFRRQIRRRVKAREASLRHVLILICGDDPPNDQFEAFQRLTTGTGEEKRFDACYVMMSELEPGTGAGRFFQASHVWPVAVDGLLVKLMHDASPPDASPTPSFAWRYYQLAPDIPSTERQRLCSTRLDDLFTGLADDDSTLDSTWNASEVMEYTGPIALPELMKLDDPSDDPELSDVSWEHYFATERLMQVTDETRWESSLDRIGRQLGSRLSEQLLASRTGVNEQVEKIWASVHRNPHFLNVALAEPALNALGALDDRFEKVTAGWQEILDKDQQRDMLIDDARQCAIDYDLARRGFVGATWRIAAILAVTLALGYASMSLFRLLSGGWMLPCLVALAGLAGAVLGGLLSFDRERRAGRRAQKAFRQQLREIDDKVRQRHVCCQKAVDRAHRFCQALRSQAEVVRMKRLLRRVQVVMDHELRSTPLETSEHLSDPRDTSALMTSDRTEASERRRQRQQTRFRQEVRLVRNVALDELRHDGQSDPLDLFVEAQTESFRDKLWIAFCDEFDRYRTGYLPAAALIPRLRRFREQFQVGLLAATYRAAIDRLGGEVLGAWGEEIKSILEYRPWFELMSCRVLARETEQAADRPLAKLYVREESKFRELMNTLHSASVADKPLTTQYLRELPIFGLLYHELPVRFGEGPDGTIVVVPYRKNPRREKSKRKPTRKK